MSNNTANEDYTVSYMPGYWKCIKCEEWVPNGVAHICKFDFGNRPDYKFSYSNSPSEYELLKEILNTLKEISKKLDRVNGNG